MEVLIRRGWLLILSLLLSLAVGRAGGATAPTGEQVKAVFVFNFSHFVEWPAASFDAVSSPFVICVLGSDSFGDRLDEVVQGEKLDQHPLTVNRLAGTDDTAGCEILFIDQTRGSQLPQVIKALNGRTTLTVTDTARAAEQGAMIQFVTENNRIRLRINVEAARAAGLTISSKLLRPAEIVAAPKD